MKQTLTQFGSFALVLATLSACSSAPTKTETAAIAPAPRIEEILAERVIAQNNVIATIGKQELATLLNGATNQVAKIEIESAVKQAALELGLNYKSKLSDKQAGQIVNRVFLKNSGLRANFKNSNNEGLANAAREADKTAAVKTDIDMGSEEVLMTGENMYKGFGTNKYGKKMTQNFMTYKHYTGANAMDPSTCTIMKSLDEQAGKNVVAYYDDQAQMVYDLAMANKGLSKAQLSECALNIGALKTVEFYADVLHYQAQNIAAAVEQVEGVCHLARKGTAAKVKNLLANNTLEQLKSLPRSCN